MVCGNARLVGVEPEVWFLGVGVQVLLCPAFNLRWLPYNLTTMEIYDMMIAHASV